MLLFCTGSLPEWHCSHMSQSSHDLPGDPHIETEDCHPRSAKWPGDSRIFRPDVAIPVTPGSTVKGYCQIVTHRLIC
jgi:hypothetical protein